MKGIMYYELLKSNETISCRALLITINRFKSCFEPKMFNNLKENAKWFYWTTMLDHTLYLYVDTLMESFTTRCVFIRLCFFRLHLFQSMQHLVTSKTYGKNKKIARWMDCFKGQTFFIAEFTYWKNRKKLLEKYF